MHRTIGKQGRRHTRNVSYKSRPSQSYYHHLRSTSSIRNLEKKLLKEWTLKASFAQNTANQEMNSTLVDESDAKSDLTFEPLHEPLQASDLRECHYPAEDSLTGFSNNIASNSRSFEGENPIPRYRC